MKHWKKSFSFLLALSIMTVTTVSAADSVKNETVYVNFDYYGRMERAIVVNSFKVNGNNTVIDYGNYKSIKNLTSTEKPKMSNGYIEWKVDPQSANFHYQGELYDAALPWNFQITYTLDGREVAAEELIGANGHLELILDAKANPNVGAYFADNYLAQITIVLDAEMCKNIDAPDAMGATVGSSRQLTLMVLPKMDKTFRISADVTDFEMDGMTMAMVKVSDGILGNIDDLKAGISSMSSGIDQLMTGSGQLKNGAADLAQGVGLLDAGASNMAQVIPSVTAGMDEFGNGVESLHDGLTALSNGSGQIRSGLMELDSKSYDISKGIGQISDGLHQIMKNKQAVEEGLRELEKQKSSLSQISQGGATLKSGYKQIETALHTMRGNSGEILNGMSTLQNANPDLSQLTAGAGSIQTGISSLQTVNQAEAQIISSLLQAAETDPALAKYAESLGMLQYLNNNAGKGLSELSGGASALNGGIGQAQTGMNTLYGAAQSFGSAAVQMAEGAEAMYDNMVKLNNGLDTLITGAGKATDLYTVAVTFGNSALQMTQGAEALYEGTETLSSGFGEYADAVGTLSASYITLDNGIFDAENGAQNLYTGFTTLQEGSGSLFSAVDELTDSIGKLNTGAESLYEGVEQLTNGGEGAINTLFSSESDIAGLVSMSASAEPVSFAAPDAVRPDSVQFVIKTPNLHKEEQKSVDEDEQKLSFWQKLAALFKGKA